MHSTYTQIAEKKRIKQKHRTLKLVKWETR